MWNSYNKKLNNYRTQLQESLEEKLLILKLLGGFCVCDGDPWIVVRVKVKMSPFGVLKTPDM